MGRVNMRTIFLFPKEPLSSDRIQTDHLKWILFHKLQIQPTTEMFIYILVENFFCGLVYLSLHAE